MYNTASHIRWMASWMVSRFERKNTSPFFKYTDYKSWVASHFHPFRRKTLQLRLLDIQNMKLQMIQCDPQILLFDMRQWACPLLNECEKNDPSTSIPKKESNWVPKSVQFMTHARNQFKSLTLKRTRILVKDECYLPWRQLLIPIYPSKG